MVVETERQLLSLMAAEEFDALVTVDKHLEFQQNLQTAGTALIVVHVVKNRLKELRPLAPKILEALAQVSTGRVVHVGRD